MKAAQKMYTLSAKVWLYPSDMAAWHFVTLDKKVGSEIKELFGKHAKGFGSLPVEVTVGKTTWRTSIFPDKISQSYLLPIKAAVRKREGIEVEESVKFTINLL